MDGWISLYRQIQKGWLWEDKPFSRGQAWIDMLLSANHKDKKIPFDKSIVEVKRGSYITSIRKLCNRWGWSNTKVINFLDLCVIDEMLTYKSDTKKTVITITNYDLYQNETSQKRHQNDTKTTPEHTNNNNIILSLLNNSSSTEDNIHPKAKEKLLAIKNSIFGSG